MEQNPELMEAKTSIQVVRQIPAQAGSLDDPMLQFEFKNLPVDTFAFDQEAMTQKILTLSQKLPFPGKLGMRSDMAVKDIDIAEEHYDALKLKIIREVKMVDDFGESHNLTRANMINILVMSCVEVGVEKLYYCELTDLYLRFNPGFVLLDPVFRR